MTAKTNTERQRDLYARRKAQGLVKVCGFVHETRAAEAREALAQMMEPKMSTRNATPNEVREHHKRLGHSLRMKRDGDDWHVEYKPDGEGPWLEGRWVSEYIIDTASGEVRLT